MPPRPSSSHSQIPNQSSNSNSISNQNNQQTPSTDPSVTPPARPLTAPTTPVPQPIGPTGQQPPSNMAAQGSYQTQPPPPPSHMHGYKMGPSSGPGPQNMPPYPPQSQQYSQGKSSIINH